MTTQQQSTFAEFDPATAVDIDYWLRQIGSGPRPAIARKWFPGQPGAYSTVLKIRAYLTTMQLALYWRRNYGPGNNEYRRYEHTAQKYRQGLPPYARWWEQKKEVNV